MSEKLRVLHVFGRMDRGGAELRTLDLARWVDRAKYQVDFCSLSGRPGELDREIRHLGGEVHLVPLGPTFPLRFARLLCRGRYDVVHSHVLYFSGLILCIARLCGKAVRLAHFRSTYDGYADTLVRQVRRMLLRALIRRCATKILAVSSGAMEAAWGLEWAQDKRCEVVYSGIDTRLYDVPSDKAGVLKECGFPSGALLVIHVGRMDPAKNHEHLVRVFGCLAELEPRARLMLVGRGGTEVELSVRKQLHHLGLSDRVALLGARTDVPRLLRAADVMVFPSRWEGLPGAVLEACAAGVPVLSSDIPGALEIARFCPSVVTLPLTAPLQGWASKALEMSNSRSASAVQFAMTPFNVEASARRITDIWASE